MPQSLDLGSDLKERKRPRDHSRDSRRASGKSGTAKANTNHQAPTVDEAAMRRSLRMPAYLSKSKSEISEAFLDLEWKQRYRVAGALQDADSPFKLDKSAKVTQRNRYGNIQPWADSRIQLRTPIGGSDYINASPIRLQSISRRAIKQLKRTSSTASASSIKTGGEYSYIATQGPKDGQFSHFWHMVMQESIGDTGVIIMLTPCYEGNKEKCAQYFPFDKARPIVLAPEQRNASNSDVVTAIREDGDLFLNSPYRTTGSNLFRSDPQIPTDGNTTETNHVPLPDMTEAGTVELLSSTYDAEIGCVVRTLKLTIGSQEKTVIHYLYEHWPDFGKPEAEERAALLRLMKKSKEDAGESPRVVHCSAGVGRTGTFVALDFLTAELSAGRLASRTEDPTERDATTSDSKVTNNTTAEQGTGKPNDPPTDNTTYGKSGIARSKITTPELKQGEGTSITGDLIHDTVDALRQQRMMMVMNEVQYSLLYEVVRDAFLDMYAEKATGAVVVPGTDDGDRTAKAAKKSAGSQGDGEEMVLSPSSPIRSQDGEVDSDADTEIAGMTPRPEDVKGEHDPYAEVAPERIRQNLGLKG
ncbi:Tyrosine-protein phosphatase 1 [Cyphellophora attinorum]|uniref:Tyrosine-protein phosphatase 1 n=1 Tax=Cyphellophora attinorum TaxID=1664694 RepID=A0A0N0NS04_9EURO|nr:Tyrosine-protein phosphatase 1 [Phialophora attinorum]KPI45439.1 Tyrosine-protein phosphatase 1 [Phialophora attinorum]